jgi:hypothetical protein
LAFAVVFLTTLRFPDGKAVSIFFAAWMFGRLIYDAVLILSPLPGQPIGAGFLTGIALRWS